MEVFETRKNFVVGPPPVMLKREGPMAPGNPNWICIEGSHPATMIEAVRSFARLGNPQRPVDHQAALVRHRSGLFGLFFSPQLLPQVFANMVAWLADPFILEEGSTACGWTSAGREGARFLFQPDRTNRSEDTLLVRSERGDRLELYLPDGSLCPTSKVANSILEPVLDGESVELLENFTVVLESARENGNPNFLITRPRDFDWNRALA